MINILLKNILWIEFLNDLDAQSNFEKTFVTKKLVKYNHSDIKYALSLRIFTKKYFGQKCKEILLDMFLKLL